MLSSRRSLVFSGLFVAVLIPTLMISCGIPVAAAQSANAAAHLVRSPESRVMTLEPLSVEERAAQSLLKNPKTSHEVPEGFREFGRAQAGQVVETKSLTLRFATAATLTKIEGTPDFKVEQGGSCAEGYSYAANSTCTLLVRFTPQGPGRRVGKVKVTNSVDPTPLAFGIGGEGSSPAVSFTPSLITTLPGTYVSSAGLINGASNLSVDKSDTLYIADTGNNVIRYLDSSGVFNTISAGVTAPAGVVIDNFGEVFFTEPSQDKVFETYDYANTPFQINGSSNDPCTYSTSPQCDLSSEQTNRAGGMAVDSSGQLYFAEDYYGAISYNPVTFTMVRLSDPFYYQSTPNGFAVDASGNLYTGWLNAGEECQIMYQSYSDAYYLMDGATKVAGGRTCGFSGDGGQAGNAEIGTTMGQIAFDIAGNLYFTDSSNQRVRRIDALTGIITTIAGNGSIGYSGDNGPATAASLNTPTGVGVDSQGQVYIISSSATTGSAQVVRKVGTVGALYLGGMTVGSSSTAQTVTVANTGNANLDFTHVGFSSGNTTDFAIDPNTTSCNFTVPLLAGRSCKIGFIFTPSATGGRSAVLSLTDDTVAGLNTIQVSGTGYTTATLTPAGLSFASTNFGSTNASQTATLTNTGKAAMTIYSIGISGSAAPSYFDTTNCGTTLAVGASCSIAVSFKPAASGTLNAFLNVSDNALGGTPSVSLTGTGVAVAIASVSPTSLTFPSTTVGSASVAQTIKLSNTGDAALGITSVKTAGTNASDFSFTQTCGTSVAAGGSCNISVAFKPTATGTRTASISIVASTGTFTVPLTGTSVAAAKAALAPSAVTFGSQAVSSSSAVKMVTLSNSGAAALTIASYAVSGANAADFSETHSCGSTLAGLANCTISVVFKPAAAGSRSAMLTAVTSTGAVSVALGGTGVSAAVKATTVTLSTVKTSAADGKDVELSAQVKSGSSLMPTGGVQLWEASHMWAQKELEGGTARFSMDGFPAGKHLLNALYLGDAVDGGSRSATVEVEVAPVVEHPLAPSKAATTPNKAVGVATETFDPATE